MFEELITTYLIPTIVTFLGTLFAYLGAKLKKCIETKIQNETIKSIVEDCVRYTEQLANKMTSTQKFDLAMMKASDWLSEKGIKISEIELEVIIESTVQSFYGKGKKQNGK